MSYITNVGSGSGGSGILTVTGNIGGAVSPDAGGDIGITGSGAVTVTGTTGTNSLEITVSGAVGIQFDTDSGSAVPASGVLTVVGGTNITTSATGSTVTINSTASGLSINSQTGTTYTLLLTDAGKLVSLDNSDPVNLTVPLNSSVAFPVGSEIILYQKNDGIVSVLAASGVTINSGENGESTGERSLIEKFSVARLTKIDTDVWSLAYDIEELPELTWTENTSSPTTDTILGLIYNNGTWLIGDSSGGNVYVTDDPTGSWIEVTTSYTGSIGDMHTNGDSWAFLGGTDLYTATDPRGLWTKLNPDPFGSAAIRSITYSKDLDMWFIFGDQFKIYSCGSDPSGTWTARASGVSTAIPGKYIAAGGGYVVAVGNDGYTSVSTNGTTWTQYIHTSWGLDNIERVTYGDGLWIFIANKYVYIGTDPTDPSSFVKNTKNDFDVWNWQDVSYYDGLWIITTPNHYLTTKNPYGIWDKGTPATTSSGHRVVGGGGYILTVGSSGKIETAPTLTQGIVANVGLHLEEEDNVRTIEERLTINTQTGTSYTTTIVDRGKYVTMDNAAASTLTIPPNSSVAYPIGTTIYVQQLGAGQVTLTQGTGVTFRSADDAYKLAVQYSVCALIHISSDVWGIVGDVIA